MSSTFKLKLSKVTQLFNNYSQDAIEQVIEQAPGKPWRDENGEVSGFIATAKRVDGTTNAVEFTFDNQEVI